MEPEKLPIFPWKILIHWHKKSGRDYLPWRDYSIQENELIYRVWLSEILLQQTQVNRVIEFYNRMIHRFPTIHHLAKASYDEFFPYYDGLGYYSRARNLLKTA